MKAGLACLVVIVGLYGGAGVAHAQDPQPPVPLSVHERPVDILLATLPSASLDVNWRSSAPPGDSRDRQEVQGAGRGALRFDDCRYQKHVRLESVVSQVRGDQSVRRAVCERWARHRVRGGSRLRYQHYVPVGENEDRGQSRTPQDLVRAAGRPHRRSRLGDAAQLRTP